MRYMLQKLMDPGYSQIASKCHCSLVCCQTRGVIRDEPSYECRQLQNHARLERLPGGGCRSSDQGVGLYYGQRPSQR